MALEALTGRIEERELEKEMRSSYIDYAMSVIVGRALPDVRDGLKPVHRRVLYAMHDLGLQPTRPYRKCAFIVGEVMGKYHPHGDSAIYDTLVRMAQEFSLRYPLVDGQGNFGSIDDDPAAAMRYTEARLGRLATEMLRDIDADTVDFGPNYDESQREPSILPSRFPNLLVNGASGIAVGMATNIPPHNLRETVNAVTAYIDDPGIDLAGLMEHVKAPDFPGGGILDPAGVRDAYESGRGSLKVRARAHIEPLKGGKEAVIVTELPFMVKKGGDSGLITKIADLVREKKLEGISDLRDESDRSGMRIVIELKRGAVPNIVLTNLYKRTSMQTSFGVNMVALVDGVPKTLGLRELIRHYVDHQREVVTRRTQYELRRAEARAHILEGLLVALDNLDAVDAVTRDEAKAALAARALLEHFGAENVGWHQVRRELNAPRVKAEDDTHGFDELGLGQTWDTDEQRVATRQNRDQRLFDHLVLAENDRADRGLGGLDVRRRRFGGPHDHVFEFFKAFSHACSLNVPASGAAGHCSQPLRVSHPILSGEPRAGHARTPFGGSLCNKRTKTSFRARGFSRLPQPYAIL